MPLSVLSGASAPLQLGLRSFESLFGANEGCRLLTSRLQRRRDFTPEVSDFSGCLRISPETLGDSFSCLDKTVNSAGLRIQYRNTIFDRREQAACGLE